MQSVLVGGGSPAGRARGGLGLGVWRGGLEGRGGLHGGLPGRLGLFVLPMYREFCCYL